jgi:hypothetical protein
MRDPKLTKFNEPSISGISAEEQYESQQRHAPHRHEPVSLMRKEMKDLPNYLFERLLDTLRRDMRHQEFEVARNAGDEQAVIYHQINMRFSRELLQCLNPKQITLNSLNESPPSRRKHSVEAD